MEPRVQERTPPQHRRGEEQHRRKALGTETGPAGLRLRGGGRLDARCSLPSTPPPGQCEQASQHDDQLVRIGGQGGRYARGRVRVVGARVDRPEEVPEVASRGNTAAAESSDVGARAKPESSQDRRRGDHATEQGGQTDPDGHAAGRGSG